MSGAERNEAPGIRGRHGSQRCSPVVGSGFAFGRPGMTGRICRIALADFLRFLDQLVDVGQGPLRRLAPKLDALVRAVEFKQSDR
jgi:hypothetical protein